MEDDNFWEVESFGSRNVVCLFIYGDTECRALELNGKIYEAATAEMILEAGMSTIWK